MSNIHSLGSMKNKEENDDKPPADNEYYAGGRNSGIAVQGRPDADRPTNPGGGRATGGAGGLMDMLRNSVGAQQNPEEPPDDTGTRQITMTLWQNGIFSLDDGENPVVPRDSRTDPLSQAFLEDVQSGKIPVEFHVKYPGQNINLIPKNRQKEAFVEEKRPLKMFGGEGRRLGDVTPNVTGVEVETPSTSIPVTTAAPPVVPVDPTLPVTKVQIRLADGTRLVSQFNPTDPVSVIRDFVQRSQPQPREFVFMTTFPKKVIDDETMTIEAAGLNNAVLMQKYK